jgi:hypothetical protein
LGLDVLDNVTSAIMQITQHSERKLVCKKDSKLRAIIQGIAGTTAFWVILGFLVSLWIPSKQNFNSNLGIITYAIFCFGVIAFSHDHIAIFDLDSHSLKIERYFSLFKKSYSQEYDLSIIRRILGEKEHGSCNYIIILKQHDGNDLYLPSPHYCVDILMVDAEAQKIRDFLSLDVLI